MKTKIIRLLVVCIFMVSCVEKEDPLPNELHSIYILKPPTQKYDSSLIPWQISTFKHK